MTSLKWWILKEAQRFMVFVIFLTGDGARLCFAIWNHAMDFFGNRGFSPIIPPVIVRKANL